MGEGDDPFGERGSRKGEWGEWGNGYVKSTRLWVERPNGAGTVTLYWDFVTFSCFSFLLLNKITN